MHKFVLLVIDRTLPNLTACVFIAVKDFKRLPFLQFYSAIHIDLHDIQNIKNKVYTRIFVVE